MELGTKFILLIIVAVAGWVALEMFIHFRKIRKLRAMRSRHEGARRADARFTDALGFDPNTDQPPHNRRAGGQRREQARMDQSRGRRATDALGSIGQRSPDRGYVEQ